MKKTPPGRERLPSDVSRAMNCIDVVQHGFDRLDGHINSSDPTLPLEKLRSQSRRVRIKLGAKSHAPVLGTAIKVSQPSRDCLITMRDELGDANTLVLNYVEIAVDLMPHKGFSTRRIRNWVLKHLTIKYLKQRVHRPEGYKTFYLGPRANKSGQRRPRVVAVYADRGSKLQGPHKGRMCVHIEARLTGRDALASCGIFGVADLIDFDFGSFWRRVAQLRRIGNAARLGGLLSGRGNVVTDKALRKRVQRLKANHKIGTAFVLQNALLAEPAIGDALEEIDIDLIFRFSGELTSGSE